MLPTAARPGCAGPRRGEAELLREEHPRRHAVVGAHGRGTDDRLARRPRRNGDILGLPGRRRPGHPDLAGQPRRARAARAPVDGHQGRQASKAPTGSSSTSTRASGAGLHECCQVALLVRERLAERNLETEAVTSGSKGLHLYAALQRRKTPTTPRRWPRRWPRTSPRRPGRLVTATMTKSKRSGKVFLDWSQNAGSKTTLSPVLAARARAADGRHTRHLGGGRGRRRRPAGPRAVPVRGGARATGRRSVDPRRVRSVIVTKAFMFCGGPGVFVGAAST